MKTTWDQRNPEKSREVKRRWAARNYKKQKPYKERWRDENPEKHYAQTMRWMVKNREKVNAQARVRYAIKRGKLARQPCQVCGEAKSHGHHTDYNKPLEVVWLCALHHAKQHKKWGSS